MFLWICFLAFVGSIFCHEANEVPLNKALESLERALQYMNETVSAINLDAVFCIRRLEEQMEALLKYEPEVFEGIQHRLEKLQNKAHKIANRGMSLVLKASPGYASKVGFLMKKSPELLWYPSRSTLESLIEKPVSCENGKFNRTNSDNCFKEISGPRFDNDNPCGISFRCLRDEKQPRQREWTLTHQVLYWELLEQWQCVNQVPLSLRDRLCSNVMRDARITELANFPRAHHDIFLEQIGLCGIWGYKDFNKPEWLQKILEWQEPSGCYASSESYKCFDAPAPTNHVRVKRSEKLLSDGCLSHETGVALLALAANVRFEAEKEYEINKEKRSSMLFMK
ncbi:unnamed protein product [Larinioides sclopetarius]|uniref:Uncharacterized protein n=1 Tax=Larinioides sclopetarius TaxID=280406 RepID=A0AAV2BF70_9ARAC